MDVGIAFGRVLRRLRVEAGFTQEQFGFESDLRRTYISILELGQQQPSLMSVFKIAKALNCSASELIAHVEDEMKSQPHKRNLANSRR